MSKEIKITYRRVVAGLGLATVIGAGAAFSGAHVEFGKPANAGSTTNPSGLEKGTPNPSEAAGSVDLASIAGLGKDAYSKDVTNWAPIKGTDGKVIGGVMTPEPHGLNSIVEVKGVAQAYLDAKVNGSHKAIALVIPDGETFPVRGISVYPTDTDAKNAFDGALKLENETQPGVYVAEVCDTMQAVPENRQDLSNPAQWEAEKITAEEAAKRFGKDDWSKNPANWTLTPDGYGSVLKVNPTGLNSVIFTDKAVAQAYWDAKVEGIHKAIALTLGVGVELPVRGATVYAGVPEGMENEAADYAFKQAINLEIDTQPGVFVGEICKTAQAKTETAVSTDQPSATTQPEATTKPGSNPTPEPTTKPVDWRLGFEKAEKLTDRAKLLPDGGLKIVSGDAVKITIDKSEKIVYWDGTKVVTKVGPFTVSANEATIYKLKK